MRGRDWFIFALGAAAGAAVIRYWPDVRWAARPAVRRFAAGASALGSQARGAAERFVQAVATGRDGQALPDPAQEWGDAGGADVVPLD